MSRKAEHAFALRGDLAGEPIALPLFVGINHLGSDPTCDLWLQTVGISKRHADLRVAEGRVVVQDLASKNGTFVNQRRIDHAVIKPGDCVVFGAVSLELVEIDPDEARMAVDLGPTRRGKTRAPTTETRNASAVLEGVGSSIFSLATSFVENLGPRDADDPFSDALRYLACEVPLRGLCLFSVDGAVETDSVELAFTASAGDIAAVDVAAVTVALAQSAGGEPLELLLPAGGVESEPMLLLADPRRQSGFLAWGERIDSPEMRALLRLVLAISSRFSLPEEAGALKSPESFAELVFPQGYVIGESPAMLEFYGQLQPVVHSDLPVLVLGETGTGKESVAQILHASSNRCRQPLVSLNCAAIPHDLIEAELFGIGGGVATGVAARVGKFQEANGGTLFLDEIGDLPISLQAKLLRALQDGDVRPVGRRSEPVDVRIVAATNGDLEAQMEAGLFRRDLYYRLAGLVVQLPPLRHRADDLPALVAYFLRREAARAEKAIRGLTVGAMKRLSLRPWPGNVRELEHEVRRLVYMAGASYLISADMVTAPPICGGSAEAVDFGQVECLDLGEIEKLAVVEALRRADGKITEAARGLGITRQALRRRMSRHGL